MSVRVAPIVNISERDLSYLPQAVQDSPYMYVGLFEKGQAFIPKLHDIYGNYVNEFGTPSVDYKIGYAVQGRMVNGGNVAVVRILGQNGYIPTTGYALTAGTDILGYVRTDMPISVASGGTITAFNMAVNSGTTANFTGLSLIETSTSTYIKNILSYVPNMRSASANTVNTKASVVLANAAVSGSIYVEKLFNYKIGSLSASATVGLVTLTALNSYVDSYSNSTTTKIVSKPITGEVFDLFDVATFPDGNSSIYYKVAFDNIDTASGKFNMSVLDSDDNVLESFSGLTMDETSDRYVGKAIGNTYSTVNSDGTTTENGDFSSKSKYIYLTNINTTLPTTLVVVPGGFKGYIGNVSGSLLEPPLPLKRNQLKTSGALDSKIYFGVDFDYLSVYDFLSKKPVTMTNGTQAQYKGFLVSDGVENTSLSSLYRGVNSGSYGTATYDSTAYDASASSSYVNLNNFICAVYGGFDGFDEEVSTEAKLKFNKQYTGGAFVTTTTVINTIGYGDIKLAADAISYPEFVDYKLLFTPSIYQTEAVDYFLSVVENRADALYIPDLYSATAAIDTAIATTEDYDTSYAGVFYPGIKFKDTTLNKEFWLDPSIVASKVFANNDRVAHPWFVSAGYTRGKVSSGIRAYKKLTQTQRDDLYKARINPIATFSSQGEQEIIVWGNRTLQVADSALSDINIRRMLIEARKFVSSVSYKLLFEPLDQDLFDAFKNATEPYFQQVKTFKGLYDFKVVMNYTTTTPDDIDRNELNGYILLKPTKFSEQINIAFVLTRTGATFAE